MSTQKSVLARSNARRKLTKQDSEIRALLVRLKRGKETENTLKKSMIVTSLIKKHDMSPETISELSKISASHIYNMKKIGRMPLIVRTYIKEGTLGASDALKISRNKANEKAFIDTVEKYLKEKEKAKKATQEISFFKKEQIFHNNKISPAKRDEFKEQLKVLIAKFSPARIPSTKLRTCSDMVTQLIAG